MSNPAKADLINIPAHKPDPVSIRQKWNDRYAGLDPDRRREPTPFVRQCLSRLPVTGRALDVAAGAGRHSLALAEHGLRVDAVDISGEGFRLARQRAREAKLDSGQIQFIVADVERTWLPFGHYDVILVTFFLHRPLFPLIKRRLVPGGWLVYQTFTDEQVASSTLKPSRPNYLLKPGELKNAFSDFEILIYAEDEHRGHPTARLLARKPARSVTSS